MGRWSLGTELQRSWQSLLLVAEIGVRTFESCQDGLQVYLTRHFTANLERPSKS